MSTIFALICLFHRLIGQFERIAEQAVRTPMSTAELMEIIAFLGKAKTQTIPDLEKKLVQAKDELIFLLDNTELPPADLRLNTNMFSWIERMPAAFEEHTVIAKEKTEQFKEALTVIYAIDCLCSIEKENLFSVLVET